METKGELSPPNITSELDSKQEYARQIATIVDGLLEDCPDIDDGVSTNRFIIADGINGVDYGLSYSQDHETSTVTWLLSKSYINDGSRVNSYEYRIIDSTVLCTYMRYPKEDEYKSSGARLEEVRQKIVDDQEMQIIEEILENIRLYKQGERLEQYLDSGDVPEAGEHDFPHGILTPRDQK